MPQKWPQQKRQELLRRIHEGLSIRQAAAQVGVSPATAVRWTQAAGVSRPSPRRLAPAARAALRVALGAGARAAEAAEAFQVSRSTVARLAPPRDEARARKREALFTRLAEGCSRRRAAALVGLSVATAIRWARQAPAPVVPAALSPRRSRPPRFRPDRDAKRAELFAAIDSGLSRRRAAAEVGLPVATAIRWASDLPRR